MAYATIADVEARLGYEITNTDACEALLDDAEIIIDAYNPDASLEAKKVVSVRMVVRAFGSVGNDMPIGATQGTISALGYSQTWTMSNGSTGELYISKLDKKLLGVGSKIGSHSVLEGM